MSSSPILHFQRDEPELLFVAPSPILVFERETSPPASPTFVFVRDDSPPPEPEAKLGSFHVDDVDFCSFVLSRGARQGQMCCKIATHSLLLEREVPACIHHLQKYEEIAMLTSSFLTTRTTYAASYAEYDSPPSSPAATKTKTKKQPFTLDSIPKAIERHNECTVCFEPLNPLVLPCGHTVCFDCVPKLKKDICPMCRKTFKKEDLRRL